MVPIEEVEQINSHEVIPSSSDHELAVPQPKVVPTIRVVHIFSPIVVQADVANFRSLVQQLTGNKSPRSKRGLTSLKNGSERIFKRSKLSSDLVEQELPEENIPSKILETKKSDDFVEQSILGAFDIKDVQSESAPLDNMSAAGQLIEMGGNEKTLLPDYQPWSIESVPEVDILSGLTDIYDQLLLSAQSRFILSSPMHAEVYNPFLE